MKQSDNCNIGQPCGQGCVSRKVKCRNAVSSDATADLRSLRTVSYNKVGETKAEVLFGGQKTALSVNKSDTESYAIKRGLDTIHVFASRERASDKLKELSQEEPFLMTFSRSHDGYIRVRDQKLFLKERTDGRYSIARPGIDFPGVYDTQSDALKDLKNMMYLKDPESAQSKTMQTAEPEANVTRTKDGALWLGSKKTVYSVSGGLLRKGATVMMHTQSEYDALYAAKFHMTQTPELNKETGVVHVNGYDTSYSIRNGKLYNGGKYVSDASDVKATLKSVAKEVHYAV